MNTTASAVTARELEDRQRKVWGLGDYPVIATEVVAALGQELVDAAGIGPGMRVLDVAAGTGNAAIAAAAAGAEVTASDLVPALLECGRQRAAAQGLELTWRAANAEALPFDDGEFDTVMSCIGVMFAPHHQQAAAELARVCRPGGTIAVLSWTPEGFIGQMFAAMRPFVPAPPPGASPPPLWGSEGHVVALLNGGIDDLTAVRRTLPVSRFADGATFRDYFKTNYGPTIVAYRSIAEDPDRVAELDSALAELGDTALAGPSGMQWEYLTVVARRAS